MAGPQSGKDDNSLWRDLAATVVQQVADRIRTMNDPHGMSGDSAATGSPDWDPQTPSPRTTGPSPPPAQTDPWSASTGTGRQHRGASNALSQLGGELKKLMTAGISATAEQLGEYRSSRDRHAAERARRQAEAERKRAEAPMRRARSRSRLNNLGAAGMGLIALGGVGSTVELAVAAQAPDAVSSGVVAGGFAVGTYVLARRGRRFSRLADEEAGRLGAASASAVTIRGASAYSLTLPPQSSLAYSPTRRLVTQQRSLAGLLPDIEQLAPELAPLARESETALAAYAERIVKLERAQAAAPGVDAVDAALARACAQYEEGVEAHQKLVEAAATVMAELTSTGIGDPAHHSIGAGADRLQGLAEGLRQVRHDIPTGHSDADWAGSPTQPTEAGDREPPPPPAPRPARGRAGKSNRRRGVAG